MPLGRKTQESSGSETSSSSPSITTSCPKQTKWRSSQFASLPWTVMEMTSARVWFEEGVAPVQDQLRGIARYRLGDVHRVSELAETTVHKLWEQHGENAGFLPWHRVLTRAEWEARHMAMGGSPWRKAHTVPLALGSLERRLYRKRMADGKSWEETL